MGSQRTIHLRFGGESEIDMKNSNEKVHRKKVGDYVKIGGGGGLGNFGCIIYF